MKTDVLFINPGNPRGAYQGLLDEFTAVATPIWALLIAGYLRRAGRHVVIYDVNVDGWGATTANDLLSVHNPALVVMMVYGHHPSASTQTMPIAGLIAKDIKKINSAIPVLMGGTHPSALPERTLLEEAVDFVAQGEGVYTVEGLLKCIEGKENIASVPGLWRLVEGLPAFTTPATVVQDLDKDFASYPWDLLPSLSHYRAHNMHCFQYFAESQREDFADVRSPYVTLFSSLGCPYSCSFCCINAVYGKPSIRYWSVERVISWIDVLVGDYGIRNIRFDDELFVLDHRRIESLCDILINRNYSLNIQVYARVDSVRTALLKKMKDAGVNWIALGIEAADEAVRQGVGKRTRADVRQVVHDIQDCGINVLGNYIFGLPDDNHKTMNDTLDLALELNCEFVNFYCTMAYPGSQLYQEARERGEVLPDRWEGFAQLGYQAQPLPTKHLRSEEVLRFRDEAFVRYFTSPHYREMIDAKYGHTVQRHIEKMLQIQMRRKILEIG